MSQRDSLFKETEDFHTTFQILDKRTGKILLTEHLEMHILELSKLGKSISEIQTNLEAWAYFFKEVHKLEEDALRDLRTKNSMVDKAIDELEYLSQDPKTRERYEEQLKIELDYNSGIYAAYRDGKLEGLLETARKMKDYGDSIEKIIFITGLSENQLRENRIV